MKVNVSTEPFCFVPKNPATTLPSVNKEQLEGPISEQHREARVLASEPSEHVLLLFSNGDLDVKNVSRSTAHK